MRFLPTEEWNKLESIYKEYNDVLPNPNISSILVEEDEQGNIIAFCTVALKPTITMWIDERYRHNGLWKHLIAGIIDLPIIQMEDTYIIASKPETKAMCDMLGLRLIDKPVYVKDKALAGA